MNKSGRWCAGAAALLLAGTLPLHVGCPNSPLADSLAAANARNIEALKDSSFGVIFTTPHFPNSTLADVQDSFDKARTVCDHLCHIWEWVTGDNGFIDATNLAQEARKNGFRLLLQMGPHRLGDVTPPEGMEGASFRDPIVQQRYINDAVRLAKLQPDWLVLGTEINLLARIHPDEYTAFTELYKRAYPVLKAIAPNTLVGVSYHLVVLFNDKNYGVIEQMGPQDFIGFTTYPDNLVLDGFLAGAAEIPTDYYAGLKQLANGRPIGFTEVGFTTYEDASRENQRVFLSRLPEFLGPLHPIFITWASLHDVPAFDTRLLSQEQTDAIMARFGADPAILFERLTKMGLFQEDGTAKPSYFTALSLFGRTP